MEENMKFIKGILVAFVILLTLTMAVGCRKKNPDPPVDRDSEGLVYTSNGDGSCYVSGIGDCKDTEIRIDEKVAKIMVMGDEMQGKPGVAASVFRCLWNSEIHIINISASEIGISMLVNADEAEAAMECLNRDFRV